MIAGLRKSKWTAPPVIAVISLVLACCGDPSTHVATTRTNSRSMFIASTIPKSQVGSQLKWFLGAVADLPLSREAIVSHFDQLFVSKITPDQVNEALARFSTTGGASLSGLLSETPTSLVAVAEFGTTNLKINISVDNTGLIDGLLLALYLPSWTTIDSELATLAPNVSFLAARVSSNGTCLPIHQVNSSIARPLASEFKLFVLGALANQIASGDISWSDELTVEANSRSIGNPPGSASLQFSPTGTKVSVQETATKMISLSDNTAADMLINLVGRSAVEAQVQQWSTHASQNIPFLTTKELFLLHYFDYPNLANRYLSMDSNGRGALLASSVDHLSLSGVKGSTEPRDVEKLEWFASPEDICHAFVGLRSLSDQPGLSPISSIFSVNTGDLGLETPQWSTVWFKGGSEPGVATLGYLATDSKGQSFVVSAMLSNPTSALSTEATFVLLSVAKAAFELVNQA
jgi:Beta-lactamase enzyme family/ORF 12 gene product N-terminal